MGALTVHAMTPRKPVVMCVSVAVFPGDDVLILDSKTLREQLNADAMEGLRGKALGYDELPESEHCLAVAPGVVSAVAVSLRRIPMSLGAMQTMADPEEGPNAMKDSSIEDLLGPGPGMVMESEIDSEKRVQALERA